MRTEVDKYFPRNGSCMFHRTRYARHRVVDAIKMRHKCGESISLLAKDYGRSRSAIKAAINSTPNDHRMTPKEIRESDEDYRKMLSR